MRRSKQGFTLVEMLATTLIILLLSGAIAVGIATSSQVYTDSSFTSESGLLASTLNTALSDLLRYAEADPDGKTAKSNGTPLFTNPDYGVTNGYLLIQDGKFYLRPSSGGSAEPAALVSAGSYADMQVKNLTLTYSDGIFSGSYTIVGKDAALTKQVTFEDRALNAQ